MVSISSIVLRILHIISGLALIVLSVSKIVALVYGVPTLLLYNPVVPFVSNGQVFIVAIIFEFIVGVSCIFLAGRPWANIILLVFTLLMIVYKIGVVLVGGNVYGCSCLGVFSILFRISKRAEDSITFFILLLFLVSIGFGFRVNQKTKSTVGFSKVNLIIFFVIITSNKMVADQNIFGNYNVVRLNAETGFPFTNSVNGIDQSADFTFEVRSSGNHWWMRSTNQKSNAIWMSSCWDGEKMVIEFPKISPFVPDNISEPGKNVAIVVPKNLFLTSYPDANELYFLWIVFGLDPKASFSKQTEEGLPLVWETPRLKPYSYGWQWFVSHDGESKYLEKFIIVRNSKYDLNRRDEMLRDEINYPTSLPLKNYYLSSILMRQNVTNGFKIADYAVTDWFDTQTEQRVPRAAEVTRWLYGYPFPHYKIKLKVSKLTEHNELHRIKYFANKTTEVDDYRFRVKEGKKFYQFSKYQLAPGEFIKLKSDPKVEAEIKEYLKNGPDYDSFEYSNKQILVWVAGVIFLISPIIIILKKSKK